MMRRHFVNVWRWDKDQYVLAGLGAGSTVDEAWNNARIAASRLERLGYETELSGF